jgi:hypothetical protein
MRGPVVYCLEDADLPVGVSALDVHIALGARLTAEYRDDLLGGVGVIKGQAVAISDGENVGDYLYKETGSEAVMEMEVTMVPYFAWNNRGIGAMTVWIPIQPDEVIAEPFGADLRQQAEPVLRGRTQLAS